MRRATFDKRVRAIVKAGADKMLDRYTELIKDRFLCRVDALARQVGLGEWDDGYSPYLSGGYKPVGGDHPDFSNPIIDDLEAIKARLAQLECPKHSYTADTCVKCGAPRKGAK